LGLSEIRRAAHQFLSAAAVESAGSGISLMPGDGNGDAMRDAVVRLLVETPFRDAADRVRVSIASMPSPTTSQPVLESLP
jgi:UDP:flavonoid glycosyltransferase YjiC (YdhE family)